MQEILKESSKKYEEKVPLGKPYLLCNIVLI